MQEQTRDAFDLRGMRFGKLTAVRVLEGKNSKAKWECRCDCGRVKAVSYHSLVVCHVSSCGCARGESRKRDLTGQRFGRLVAVESVKQDGATMWRCRCDCGRETLASTAALTGGRKQSCGCLAEEAKRARFTDLTGQRFGRLLVIEPTDRRSGGSVVWRCQCDCGRESFHAAKALQEGRARSCGCLRQENDTLQRKLRYVDGTCVEFIENTGKLRSDNTSGCRGVRACRGGWQARITFKKKTYMLGTYADKEEAIRVRKAAENRVYGEFLDWYYENFPQKEADSQPQTPDGPPSAPDEPDR